MSKPSLCYVCQKEGGVCNCAGCKVFFCAKDFMDHRQMLSGEFEKLIENLNQVQEEMGDRKGITQLQTSLLFQINQWEIITTQKVRYAAEQTRHQVIQLITDKIKDVENKLNDVSKQLVSFQEMNNFVEDDLIYLKDKINKLGKQFREIAEPSSIKLHEEQSEQIDWTSIIHATDKHTYEGKFNVCCLFTDDKCPWMGPRDHLGNHLIHCTFGSLRSKLHKFYDVNTQLKEQIKQQNKWIDKNELDIGQLRQQSEQRAKEINEYETKIHQLEEQINQEKVQNDDNQTKIRQIRERLKQRNIEINKNKDAILLLKDQLEKKSVQVDINKIQINELQEEIKQLKITNETRQLREQLNPKKVQKNTNRHTIRLLRQHLLQANNRIDAYKFYIQQLIEKSRGLKVEIQSKTATIKRSTKILQERETDIMSIKTQLTEKQYRGWYYHCGSAILILILGFNLIFNWYTHES